MNSRTRKIMYSILGGIIVFIIALFVIKGTSRKSFNTEARDDMELIIKLNRAEFEAQMNEQLTLVLQMMRMPSIKEYLLNPDDKTIQAAAFRDFGSFKDAFKSKSIFWVSDVDKIFWSDMVAGYVVNPTDLTNTGTT